MKKNVVALAIAVAVVAPVFCRNGRRTGCLPLGDIAQWLFGSMFDHLPDKIAMSDGDYITSMSSP